jgi:hypothetical protein
MRSRGRHSQAHPCSWWPGPQPARCPTSSSCSGFHQSSGATCKSAGSTTQLGARTSPPHSCRPARPLHSAHGGPGHGQGAQAAEPGAQVVRRGGGQAWRHPVPGGPLAPPCPPPGSAACSLPRPSGRRRAAGTPRQHPATASTGTPPPPPPTHPPPQITWQTPTGFKFSADGSLAPRGSFETPLRDGWGLTSDGKHLIATDGSDTITWVDPADMSKVGGRPGQAGGARGAGRPPRGEPPPGPAGGVPAPLRGSGACRGSLPAASRPSSSLCSRSARPPCCGLAKSSSPPPARRCARWP